MWFTDNEFSFLNRTKDGGSPEEFPLKDLEYVIGLDEAGRGCMAGPVAASAVLLRVCPKEEKMLFPIDDSKKLSMESRNISMNLLCEAVHCNPTAYQEQCFKHHHAVVIHPDAVMRADPHKSAASSLTRIMGLATYLGDSKLIDEINISNASLESMSCACRAVLEAGKLAKIPLSPTNTAIFLDGKVLPWTFLSSSEKKKFQKKKKMTVTDEQRIKGKHYEDLALFHCQCVVGGDQKLYSIACASIISKVVRDAYCVQVMHPRYPKYDFAVHKGYCTKRHQELLFELGPTEYHRFSYKPVQLAALNHSTAV